MFVDLQRAIAVTLVFAGLCLLMWVVTDWKNDAYDQGFTDGTAQAIQLDTVYVMGDTLDMDRIGAFHLEGCKYVWRPSG